MEDMVLFQLENSTVIAKRFHGLILIDLQINGARLGGGFGGSTSKVKFWKK
jgi:hypothetical protein